ncbi:DUF2478 domain-containing protein [Breoghania sp.]|uniref:DUF2478 domain-containing protein n=1 Tax=Breoghania sp. TaxID=2065378 RepID=UPI0029CA2FB5|nr:DUF2478 domain-containing protein [Breoghania sp.]
MTSHHRIASIDTDDRNKVEPLFDAVVAALKADGVTVGGFIERAGDDPSDDLKTIAQDIQTGKRYTLLRSSEAPERCCRIDPHALGEVNAQFAITSRALQIVNSSPDLILFHRFGGIEVKGEGLRIAFEKACASGVPILTAVAEQYQPDWAAYCEGKTTVLPADTQAVLDWCRNIATKNTGQ